MSFMLILSIKIAPSLISYNPVKHFINVVLPEPFEPTIIIFSFGLMSKFMLLKLFLFAPA